MYSKLAFSITAILDTEIILIDEVLSVGDINFREKSYEKMKEIIRDKSKTVMIVSHSNASILELCDEVIWIHDGLVKEYGPAKQVVEDYEASCAAIAEDMQRIKQIDSCLFRQRIRRELCIVRAPALARGVTQRYIGARKTRSQVPGATLRCVHNTYLPGCFYMRLLVDLILYLSHHTISGINTNFPL